MNYKSNNMKNVVAYLASPFGFTDAGQEFMKQKFSPMLKNLGLVILNPWDSLESTSTEIKKILTIENYDERISHFKSFNMKIAKGNEEMINKSDIVIAVLDGTDVDSGVSAEIGFAYANGKKIIGYRGDFRVTGDNVGAAVNLQVEYFISQSGGTLVTSLEDLENIVKKIQNDYN